MEGFVVGSSLWFWQILVSVLQRFGRFLGKFNFDRKVYSQLIWTVFNDFLEGLIESFALEELVFNVGNQSWIVQVGEDRTLESTSFATFSMALGLKRHDYIMVSVSWEQEVQLIVFQLGNNREKVYGWF